MNQYARKSSIWIVACLMLVVMGVAVANPSSREKEYNYNDVARVGVIIEGMGGAEPETPSHIDPAIEPVNPKIFGEIFVMGRPVPGVLIKADHGGTSCLTDENGQFEVDVPYKWFGSITPVKAGWIFDPPHKDYRYVIEDVDERLTAFEQQEDNISSADVQEDQETDDNAAFSTIPPALGHFGVTPMVISMEGVPGETMNASVSISNMGIQSPYVTLEVADLQQPKTREWKPTLPNQTVSLVNAYSCHDWIVLDHKAVALSGMAVATCAIEIHVPEDAQGFYSAAIIVCIQDGPQGASRIDSTLVVPVLVEVDHDKAVTDIKITNIDLVVPFTCDETRQPQVRITIQNQGATMRQFQAFVVASEDTDMSSHRPEEVTTFDATWIMPGASVVLDAEYVGPVLNDVVALQGRFNLVDESSFTKHIPLPQNHRSKGDPSMGSRVKSRRVTKPSQTLVMLDYNDHQSIHLEQDSDLGDPFHTYSGQCDLGISTNFETIIQTTIKSCSKAQGQWTATACPAEIQAPTHVTLTVIGRDVAVGQLAKQDNVSVAKLGVQIMPQIGRWR